MLASSSASSASVICGRRSCRAAQSVAATAACQASRSNPLKQHTLQGHKAHPPLQALFLASAITATQSHLHPALLCDLSKHACEQACEKIHAPGSPIELLARKAKHPEEQQDGFRPRSSSYAWFRLGISFATAGLARLNKAGCTVHMSCGDFHSREHGCTSVAAEDNRSRFASVAKTGRGVHRQSGMAHPCWVLEGRSEFLSRPAARLLPVTGAQGRPGLRGPAGFEHLACPC